MRSVMILLAVAVTADATVVVSNGEAKAKIRPEAFEKLAKSDQLYGKLLGQVPSPMFAAFPSLLREPRARRWFLQLTVEGTIAGKLYGLCGLYLVDRAAFSRAEG